VEGELLEYTWRNPHVSFKLSEIDAAGRERIWQIESNSLSILRRTNVSPEHLKKGDKIRVAGWTTRRPSNELFIHNLLTPDGQEMLLGTGAEPRWSEDTVGQPTNWYTKGTKYEGNNSIFRVWSTDLSPGGSWQVMWRQNYPLTEAAKEISAAWDPLKNTVAPGCQPKGMPLIMSQPYPMEFIQSDNDIILHIEEYDTVRAIHMKTDLKRDDGIKTILGDSTGHWEGNTLVVSTGNVDYPYFNPQGVPQGSSPQFVERFRPNADGSRLEYQLVATDNEVFTEPVTITRDWVWRPDVKVEPYDCEWEEQNG